MGRIVHETVTTISSNPVIIRYAAYDNDDFAWRGTITMVKMWDSESGRQLMEAFAPAYGGFMSFRSSREFIPDDANSHDEFVLFHRLAEEVMVQIRVLAEMEVL